MVKFRRAPSWRRIKEGIEFTVVQTIFIVLGFLAVLIFAAFLTRQITFSSPPYVIDVNLVASLVVSEIPIGILFYRIFERRRSRITEAIEKTDAKSRYSHLEVLHYNFVDLKGGAGFAIGDLVVNTTKSKVYRAPDNIVQLAEEGIIRRKEYFKREDVEQVIKLSQWSRSDDEPVGKELDP